jgi:hypothetical protein
MNTAHAFVLAALLALTGLLATPALATSPDAAAQAALPPALPVSACRAMGADRIELAQSTPLDCCKGHKGICGCRAGKIVCCDGTVSKDPNCTCHSDWGVEN